MSYGALGENSRQRKQPVQKTKEACARVFKDKEVGWHGWLRMNEGKVVEHKIH